MKTLLPTLLATFFAAVGPAPAQQESEAAAESTPVPHPARPRTDAYLRTWVMLPADQPAAMVGEAPEFKERLSIVATGPSGSDETLVGRASPYQRRGYRELAPGKYTFRFVRDRDGKPETLASSDATLKAGSFTTLIAAPDQDRVALTFADDTKAARQAPEREGAEPPPPPPKEIVFYNFAPATTYQARLADPAFERDVPFGAIERVAALPAKLLNVQTIQTVNERERTTTSETDLRVYDSLSVVMVQDIYGRAVPAVIPNAVLD